MKSKCYMLFLESEQDFGFCLFIE